jgi:hypothetical protein
MEKFPIKEDRDMYKCISCGLVDPLVECGGIYYCPNPFCTASGSTNWKVQNLKGIIEERDGATMTEESYRDWLTKGMEVIDKMPYGLGAKIMALKKTKSIIRELQKTVKPCLT